MRCHTEGSNFVLSTYMYMYVVFLLFSFQACLRMFLDLDLVKRFNIEYDVLCRWLLSVKKNYRKVLYHNWRHSFNVSQMMFAVLTVCVSNFFRLHCDMCFYQTVVLRINAFIIHNSCFIDNCMFHNINFL